MIARYLPLSLQRALTSASAIPQFSAQIVTMSVTKGPSLVPMIFMAIEETILKVATNMYGADTVDFSDVAQKSLDSLKEWGLGNLPVCMAKTQYSFSHEPKVLGAPTGFTLPIREIRVNAGAGFVVAVCGSMMTMPGLPTRPAALDMDMDNEGRLTGAFR